jgi:outer membrane receptor protein involved in Fe transport
LSNLNNSHRDHRLGLLLVWGAAAAGIGAAAAVQADEPQQIEEITVTAQKRSQTAQDVPLSMSVITGENLAQQGLQDLSEAARQIPTLEIQSSTGPASTNLRLRRVGNLGNIPSFEAPVGLFEDGAFRSRSLFGINDLLGVDRIEVLNGPQSTLYGKNTSAGVVSIYTQAPRTSLGGDVEATGGSYQAGRDAPFGGLKADVSGPIGGGWGAGLAGSYFAHDYFVTSGLPNGPLQDADSRYVGRAQLSYGNGAFDARLIFEQSGINSREGSPDNTIFVPGSPAGNLRALMVRAGLTQACTANDSSGYSNCLLDGTSTNNKATAATLLANYHFDSGLTLSSITSWDDYHVRTVQNDAVQLGAPIIGYLDQQSGHSIQQELRLTSPGHQTFDWLAGAFFYDSDFLRGGADAPTFYAESLAPAAFWKPVLMQLLGAPLVMGTAGQESFVNSTQDTKYYALFGQTTWNATSAFRVNAGLRWQREDKDALIDQYQNDPTPTLITVAINRTVAPTALSRSADHVTAALTPQLDLGKNAMLYATASTGFVSGGFNTGYGTLPANQREFGDETVQNFEIGAKSEWLEHRLQLNAAVFHTVYLNYQDAAFIGAQFAVNNAPKATDQGFELGLNAVLTDQFTTELNASYANFRYTDYTNGACYPGRVPDGSSPGTCNLSGQHPIDAPPLKVSFALDYHEPVSFGRLFSRLELDWTGSYNTSFYADPRLIQDSYTWANFRFGADIGRQQVALFVDNVLNVHVTNVDALLNIFSHDPSTQSWLQPPRSFGITYRVKF